MQASESVIRRMTRLAHRHRAINLAQGFTDEPPPFPLVWAAVGALLGGSDAGIERLEQAAAGPAAGRDGSSPAPLRDVLRRLQGGRDELNQYSYPFGLPELRQAIAAYTARWSGFEPDPETETTVVLGSTEGLAAVLAALGRRGDGIVVLEPFHEMYPSQAAVFGLTPRVVTLRESADGVWRLDADELRRAAAGARLLVLNTPHNPTGKVFDDSELAAIAAIARAEDLVVVTDEIYEHIVFDGARHRSLATLPGMRERTVVVNSISKTANATGWRVGWVLSPPHLTPGIRAVHDTLVIQAPTPLQKAAVALLGLDEDFLPRSRRRLCRQARPPGRRAARRRIPARRAARGLLLLRGLPHRPRPRRSRPAGRRAAPDRARRAWRLSPATTSTPAAPTAPATCASPSAAAATPSPRPRAVCGG